MLESIKHMRLVIVTILITFGSVSLGVHDLAYAKATTPRDGIQATRQREDRLSNTSAELNECLQRLSAIAENLETALGKSKADTSVLAPDDVREQARSAAQWARALRDADRVIQAQQEKDRAQYGSDAYPPEALQRIEAAYAKYQKRRDRVLAAADSLGKAQTLGEIDIARADLQKAVRAATVVRKNQAVDVTKLPFRANEIKEGVVIDPSDLGQSNKAGLNDPGIAEPNSPPTAADLAETKEIVFAQELQAYAQRFGNDPIRIYEQIISGFKYQPYYGSQKGALETFRQVGGNDTDLASLLMALLRVSDIPCRYVRGTVDIPIAQALSWTTMTDVSAMGSLLTTAGIPGGSMATGSTITHYRLTDHVWVKAWVPAKYRGAGGGSGGAWVYLDPSFKLNRTFDGVDMQAVLQIDKTTEKAAVENNIQQHDQYSFNFAPDFAGKRYGSFQQKADTYFDNSVPANPTFGEVYPYDDIIPEKFDILPSSLPYDLRQVKSEHSEWPDSLRFKITVQVNDVDPLGGLYGYGFGSSLSYTISSPEVVGKRVTLSWIAATATDQAILDAAGGVTNVRPSAVYMKPILRIDDNIVATGSSVGLGVDQEIVLGFRNPDGARDEARNDTVVGSYNAIIFDTQGLSPEIGQQKTTDLRNATQKLGDDINNATGALVFYDRDDLFGEYLNLIGITYFSELGAFKRFSAMDHGVVLLNEISEAIVTIHVNVSSNFGIPWALASAEQGIDVDRNVTTPIPKGGVDYEKIRSFTGMIGMQASTQEHSVFDEVYNAIFAAQRPAGAKVASVTDPISDSPSGSAIKIISLANEKGIPLYSLDSMAAYNTVRGQLQISAEDANNVVNALNAGQNVLIPQRSQNIDGWVGTGYVLTDPNTGAAAYIISGGTNGGFFQLLSDFNDAFFSPTGGVLSGAAIELAGQFFEALGKILFMFQVFIALAGLMKALAEADAQGNLCPEAKVILKEFLVMVAAITIIFSVMALFLGPLFSAICYIIGIYLSIAVEILKLTLPLACNLANLPNFKVSILGIKQWIRQKMPDSILPDIPQLAGAWA